MDAGRALRVARAAVFAGLCVLLAASGHVLASGAAVSAASLLPAFAGCGAAAWLLGRRERGTRAVVLAALGTQALLHVFFSVFSVFPGFPGFPSFPGFSGLAPGQARCPATPAADWWRLVEPPPCGSPGPHAESRHTVPHDATAAPEAMTDAAAQALAGPAHGALPGGSAGMLAAHAAAALLGALWLSRGERAVFRLLRRAAQRVLPPLPLPDGCRAAPAPTRSAVPRPDRDTPAPRRPTFARSLPSRGPPAPLAVATTARRHGRGSPT
ncbi:hypothetical protein [Streptomyces sp. B6B3]|uniref:hypothetical protein n=1 Tax=Streptomyces sp. B6B3 TaxID=3153570 RepID=UPI00325CFDB9